MVGHPGPRGTSCWHPLRLIPHVGDLMRQEERLRRCHSVARAAGRAPREQRAQRQVAGCSRRLDRFRECGYELGANVERLSISFDHSANVRGVVVHGHGGFTLRVPVGSRSSVRVRIFKSPWGRNNLRRSRLLIRQRGCLILGPKVGNAACGTRRTRLMTYRMCAAVLV